MVVNSDYGNDSISALKGAERVRRRPEVYLGSNTYKGARHTVTEITGNVTDERLAGFGDSCIIEKYPDGAISVRDFGRGVPLGWNAKEENWNYFLIYEELYAGGKYENNQDILRRIDAENGWDNFNIYDYPYLITVGLNGLGAAATQYSSEYFIVKSYREGKCYTMEFEKGVHVLDELLVEDSSEETGTFIKWKPDPTVFTSIDISTKWLVSLCETLSYIAGFNVTLIDCGNTTEFPARTMRDVMVDAVGCCVEGSKFRHIVDESGDICICQCNAVMGKGGKSSEYYNNKVHVNGGAHSSGVEIAVSEFFRERAKEEGLKVTTQDYSGKLSFIIETLANKISNHGQTKDFVNDNYILECIYTCVSGMLSREHAKRTEWLMEVIDSVMQNARNRMAVEALAKNVKEIEKSIKKAKASSKFIPCRDYDNRNVDPSSIDYYIVEGDSAGNNAAKGRSFAFQCIQKIRGKSLNLWKASIDKLIANQEIKDIIAALGCGIDLGIDGYESFDISKLRVGKIIIGADADIDGKHIAILIFLIFYRLFPQILYNGMLYIAHTPLYVVVTKQGEYIYCFDEAELQEAKDRIGHTNVGEVVRFKGLGEMEPEQLWETMFNPESRRLTQIKISPDDTEVFEVLEVLFGKSTAERKRVILGSLMDEDFDEVQGSIEELIDYVDSLGINTVEVEEIVA